MKLADSGSLYSRKIAKMLQHDGIGQLLPVIEYWDEDGIFILDGPAMGVMLVCTPTAGCNDDLRNSLNNRNLLVCTNIDIRTVPGECTSALDHNAHTAAIFLINDRPQIGSLADYEKKDACVLDVELEVVNARREIFVWNN